jgi:hypothetical protein
MKEWLVTARFESRFLLLAVPPLAVLLVLHLANVALTDAVQVVIWLEALSLSFWAGLAAWYAGLRGPLLALSILAGLVISVMVLLLQVILQPGKGDLKKAAPSPYVRHATRYTEGASDAQLGLDPAGCHRCLERFVVPVVLVGVGLAERGQRPVGRVGSS